MRGQRIESDGRARSLELLHWDASASAWLRYQAHLGATSSKPALPIRDVRAITYNVWFDVESGIDLRHRALAALCFTTSKNAADIVCFQEMTKPALDRLLGTSRYDKDHPLKKSQAKVAKRLRREWLVIDFDQSARRTAYGCAIFIRKAFLINHHLDVDAYRLLLPSRYGRSMLFLELYDRQEGIRLRVGTVHLDHDDAAMRQDQLDMALRSLQEGSVAAMLMGDFNIRTLEELDPVLGAPHCMKDAMAGQGDKPTFNTTYPLCYRSDTPRLDIVLLSAHFSALNSRLIGDKSIRIPENLEAPPHKKRGRKGKVYPSDHLGVRVTARRRES